MKKKESAVIASLLDLLEFEPETAAVKLPRLGIVLELKELPYDKLIKLAREPEAQLHLILAAVTNHPEMRDKAWYHDKKGCATPVDALKKLLRKGEVDKICRTLDLLHGYAVGSVVPVDPEAMQAAAISAAVEELEKN